MTPTNTLVALLKIGALLFVVAVFLIASELDYREEVCSKQPTQQARQLCEGR